MKKTIQILGVTFFALSLLASCGGKDEKKDDEKKGAWPEASRKAYMDACVNSAKSTVGEKAEEYCACTLEKMEAAYPDPSEAQNVTADEITKMAEECLAE